MDAVNLEAFGDRGGRVLVVANSTRVKVFTPFRNMVGHKELIDGYVRVKSLKHGNAYTTIGQNLAHRKRPVAPARANVKGKDSKRTR